MSKTSHADPTLISRRRIDTVRRSLDLYAFEKWRRIGEIVIADLRRVGDFFDTPQGLFLFDRKCLRAFPLLNEPGLCAVLNSRYGINPREHGFNRVLADLQTEAQLNGGKAEIRRFAHYDKSGDCLYVSRFDGQMHKLNGTCVELVHNGTDGIFFFDDHPNWEPYEYLGDVQPGKIDALLIESVNFAEGHLSVGEQRRLLKLWLLALFFGSIQSTKIILLLLGEYGSGKTSALRRIQKFLFGHKADLLSIEKEKQDGFVATVTTDPVALFDNLDERISWLPYALSRLATGVSFSRRQLYTTNTKVEYPGVCWMGITARSVRFMHEQEDLPDRTLVLNVARIKQMRSEFALTSEIQQNRNALWSELLDELNRVVRHQRASPPSTWLHLRMADFAAFSLSVASRWGCGEEVARAFEKLERAQANLMFEDDPIHQVLELWLKKPGNDGRTLDAGTLQAEWSCIASDHNIIWPFGNGRSLGQRLGQLSRVVQLSFDMTVSDDLHTKQHLYTFGMRESRDTSPQDVSNRVLSTKLLPQSIPALPAGTKTFTYEDLFDGIPAPKVKHYAYRRDQN